MSNESNLSPMGSGTAKGTILVIEDEEMVRHLCCDMIEESGYRTLNAADGQAGIDVFQEHVPEISCVLLDLSMPVKDGLTVFDNIRKIEPQAKVILSSGYSQQEATRKFAGKKLSGFIQKPYVMDDLMAMIDQVIAAAPGADIITANGE